MCEVGEQAIANFVAEFMVGGGDNEDGEDLDSEEEEAPTRRNRNGKQRAAAKAPAQDNKAKVDHMVKGIEKAAGGKLSDVRCPLVLSVNNYIIGLGRQTCV